MSFEELDFLNAQREKTCKFLSEDIAKLRNMLNRYHDERGFYDFDRKDFDEKYSPKELAEICGQLAPVLSVIIHDWENMQRKRTGIKRN